MPGTLDPIKARAQIERFADVLNQAEEMQPETVHLIRECWKAAYMDCGHKALGRLMIGKSVDDACRRFEQ